MQESLGVWLATVFLTDLEVMCDVAIHILMTMGAFMHSRDTCAILILAKYYSCGGCHDNRMWLSWKLNVSPYITRINVYGGRVLSS